MQNDAPPPARRVEYLITCEHGGNRIPHQYDDLFQEYRAVLSTHEGYDRGALPLAKTLARRMKAGLIYSVTSRLLIELNRSPGHPRFFSEATSKAPKHVQNEIARRYYRPYRRRVEQYARAAVAARQTLIHISAHTFTPVLQGTIRTADVGLLYDPGRLAEAVFCGHWAETLKEELPHASVRKNYPYRGISDGLTTFLRRRYDTGNYIGIELEVNQKHVADGQSWYNFRSSIARALAKAAQIYLRQP